MKIEEYLLVFHLLYCTYTLDIAIKEQPSVHSKLLLLRSRVQFQNVPCAGLYSTIAMGRPGIMLDHLPGRASLTLAN